MSIRRFAIRADDYEKVHAWLKKATAGSGSAQDEKDEEKMAEAPPEGSKGPHTVPADFLPKIRWAHLGPLRLVKAAHGKEVIYVREAGTPKRLIHHKEVDGYLRDALLSPSSDVPMSRDAGYHIVQKRTVGISRRTFYKFLQKQAVLQVTRWKLPEMKRPGRPLEGRGYLELDLVEAKGRDIGKFVHHPVKDFYWITLVDRLTGWLVIQRTVHKDVASVAPKLRGMLRKMARALKTDIKYIRSDSGSEFKSDTQAVFRELKIRHKFVKSGNRVEQANRTFQKIWYRLMRLGRGDITELDVQATAIFNNTKSGVSGFTPEEALGQPDQALKAASKAAKDKRKIPKYSAVLIKVGDKVRYQMKDIVGKHGKALAYKSYRGKQWSADVYPVVKYNKHEEIGAEGEKQPGTGKYYVGGTWRFRDKLLLVPGVDATTRAMVTARHTQKKKDWQDEIGDMAL